MLLHRNDGLFLHVTAALGEYLILKMHGCHACTLKFAHGAHDIQGVAVARVDITDERDVEEIVHVCTNRRHLIHGHKAVVRLAEDRTGGSKTGHKCGFKAGLFNKTCGKAVVCAGSDDDPGLLKPFAERFRAGKTRAVSHN